MAVLPYGQALALAVVSRLLFTVVELASAGAATLVVRVSRRRTPAGPAEAQASAVVAR
jgi:glycosyltransferase 2 family protein